MVEVAEGYDKYLSIKSKEKPFGCVFGQANKN